MILDRYNHQNSPHILLSLFAIYKATVLSSAAIVIHTDCKCIVDQFHQLLLHQEPLDNVCHVSGGKPLWTIVERRQRQHPQPVKLVWAPAHIADDRADSEITDQYAAEHNTTRSDILLNREAGKVAKDTAMENAPVFPEDFQHLRKKVFDRQIFLARWNRTIGSDFIKDDDPAPNTGGMDSTLVDLRSRFPRWDWIQDPSLFQWTSNIRIEQPRGSLAKLDPVDLSTFLTSPHRFNGVYRRMSVPLTLNLPFCFGSVASFYVHALRVTPLFET